MEKQKRFKKQELKSDDYKGMEQGAKAVKGGIGIFMAAALLFKNKDNVKTLGKSVAKVASRFVKL